MSSLPSNMRVPFVGVTFDPSRAFVGPSVLRYKNVLIGQRISSGTVAELVQKTITSADQAALYWGYGSIMHRMAVAWFNNNKTSQLVGIALDDAGGSTAAVKTITFAGTATAAGTIYIYIGGMRYEVPIASGDTAANVATKVDTVLDADSNHPVVATTSTADLILTAKNKGTLGNDIDVRFNYYDGEALPAGITVSSITQTTSGATDPDIQDAIDVFGEQWFQGIIHPFATATPLDALETELDDRFGPIRQIDGRQFTAKRDSFANLVTFGNGRNSQHTVIMHSFGIPNTSWEVAAAVAGQALKQGESDPAKPFTDIVLNGILAPAIADKLLLSENNSLLYEGISTWYDDEAGKVRISRIITTYQRNSSGAEDIAYLDLTTLQTLTYLRYDFRQKIKSKFFDAKLADDGVIVPSGQKILTPSIGKLEAIAIFRGWQALGLVENIDQFINDLVCERAANDPNRLNWILPPDLINQFLVGSADIQFLLQSPSA